MKTVKIPLSIGAWLREYLDQFEGLNPNLERPDAILVASRTGQKLSDEEFDRLWDYAWAQSLKLFLHGKASFIIPDDCLSHLRELFSDPDTGPILSGEQLRRLARGIFEHRSSVNRRMKYEAFYAYQFVDTLDDIVRRALRVPSVFSETAISERVAKVCREAYQCYLWGYHNASAALIRATVEGALKQRLGVQVGYLRELNEAAFEQKLYGEEMRRKIRNVGGIANRVLHGVSTGQKASEGENLRIIQLAQEVLAELLIKG